MKTISATQSTVDNGDGTTSTLLSPATPLEDYPDRIAVICDGTNYTVYEPGDTVPPLPGTTS